eukprot:1190610-Prorocentrum_minimum.AAC.2
MAGRGTHPREFAGTRTPNPSTSKDLGRHTDRNSIGDQYPTRPIRYPGTIPNTPPALLTRFGSCPASLTSPAAFFCATHLSIIDYLGGFPPVKPGRPPGCEVAGGGGAGAADGGARGGPREGSGRPPPQPTHAAPALWIEQPTLGMKRSPDETQQV